MNHRKRVHPDSCMKGSSSFEAAFWTDECRWVRNILEHQVLLDLMKPRSTRLRWRYPSSPEMLSRPRPRQRHSWLGNPELQRPWTSASTAIRHHNWWQKKTSRKRNCSIRTNWTRSWMKICFYQAFPRICKVQCRGPKLQPIKGRCTKVILSKTWMKMSPKWRSSIFCQKHQMKKRRFW